MIKSYTDISQSKKLAEILPLESADMLYWAREYITHPYMEGQHKDEQIPIWSLAALLEEIPEVINFDDDENDYALEILKENGLYYLFYEGKVEIDAQENFVDACVAMIEKLHELKML